MDCFCWPDPCVCFIESLTLPVLEPAAESSEVALIPEGDWERYMDTGPPPAPPPPPPTPPPPPPKPEPTLYTCRIQSQIRWIAEQMGLPERILDVAVRLLHRFYILEIGKTGRSPGCGEKTSDSGLTATSAALILLACRQECVPRGFREISMVTGIKPKFIFRKFDKISHLIQATTRLERPRPEMFLARFCGNLGLGFEVEKRARQILAQSNECGSAVALAAAAILAAHNMSCLAELVSVSGVSAPTLKMLAEKIQI